ncbi:MAG: hypothetical protein AAF771_04715 [Pseudomonadota bacterium]
MEYLITAAASFVILLGTMLVFVMAQRGQGQRNGATLRLDQKSGEYIWVTSEGRTRSLSEERDG